VDLYSKCTAFIFMGLDEDFGIVPLEAMASGKVVISIDEGGPKEYIKNGENGLLASKLDEFAEDMNWIKNRPYHMEEIGKRAKQTSYNFTWFNFFTKMDKVLNNILRH
ncbi:MAG: glycosyltransferase, partial [Candidatus Micrarchaeia archaeon]